MAAASEQALMELRQLILTGDLAPGARLGEVELAAQLGVSRTPVREALRTLSSQGLVELLPNKGARVVHWSAADLDEIYVLRAMLESHAARRATSRIERNQIAELTGLCEQMEACASRGRTADLVRLSEFNSRFHSVITEAADSPRLETMLANVVQVPLAVRTFVRYNPEALSRSMSHHRELVAALDAGAPDWAASIMQSHINAARTALLTVEALAEDAAVTKLEGEVS
ncbi:DNA-binding GntR family transcriptional regulator [Mycobacterium sp. MAA66]|uniref:GntR family transcriptional regulator n=1 Tax=Mycobacterium sp. MAA66 TaxID=3156297 RepID=UPI0035196BC8